MYLGCISLPDRLADRAQRSRIRSHQFTTLFLTLRERPVCLRDTPELMPQFSSLLFGIKIASCQVCLLTCFLNCQALFPDILQATFCPRSFLLTLFHFASPQQQVPSEPLQRISRFL